MKRRRHHHPVVEPCAPNKQLGYQVQARVSQREGESLVYLLQDSSSHVNINLSVVRVAGSIELDRNSV